MFWKKKSQQNLLRFPVKASHAEYSMILSAHDDPPATELVDLTVNVAKKAQSIDLSDITKRIAMPPFYPNIWPGEHYKLLAAFVALLQPQCVIEIGTATGLSALCMQKYLPSQGKLLTYDIRPWEKLPDTLLRPEDFASNNLLFFAEDLTQPLALEKHRPSLEKAELIFIDATHDGLLEKKLLTAFESLSFTKPPLIILDDIRVWSMLKMWREIQKPKLDITSFGHWSGTGLVQWK